jgi:hypothetical protein
MTRWMRMTMMIKPKEKYPELPNHNWGKVLLDLVDYVRSLEKVVKNIDERLSCIEYMCRNQWGE